MVGDNVRQIIAAIALMMALAGCETLPDFSSKSGLSGSAIFGIFILVAIFLYGLDQDKQRIYERLSKLEKGLAEMAQRVNYWVAQTESSAPSKIYAPATVPAPQFSHSAADDEVYGLITKELAEGSINTGLWTRLFAEANGDESKTKALYIARRAEMLIAEGQSVRDQEAARIAAENNRQEKERARQLLLNKSVDFIAKTSYGNVVMLKDGLYFLEQKGKVTQYPSAADLRVEMRDHESWPPVTDNEEKLRIMRLVSKHIPPQV